MAKIITPHDAFFKRLFGAPEVAADFLRNYLPAEIVSRLDLETLQLEKESFIDPELRESFSDLLFKVKTVTRGSPYCARGCNCFAISLAKTCGRSSPKSSVIYVR